MRRRCMRMNRTLPKFETAFRLGVTALLLLAATASLAQEDRRDGAPGPGDGAFDRGSAGNEIGVTPDRAPGAGNPHRSAADRRTGGGAGLGRDGNASVDPGPPDIGGGPMRKGGDETGRRTSAPVGGVKGGTANHGGIDLVSPDEGYGNYANLRRRAARKALSALAPKRPPSVPQINLNIRTAPGVGTGSEATRNALGIVTGVTGSRHAPAFMLRGATGSVASVGTSPGVHPVPIYRVNPLPADARMTTGINGTNMGHAATGGIGGPAKSRTGINGTSFRRNF